MLRLRHDIIITQCIIAALECTRDHFSALEFHKYLKADHCCTKRSFPFTVISFVLTTTLSVPFMLHIRRKLTKAVGNLPHEIAKIHGKGLSDLQI